MGHIMEGLKWTLESGTTLAFAKNGSVGNATGRIECVPSLFTSSVSSSDES